MNITKKLFKKKLLSFVPYSWTIIKNHPDKRLNGNHQLLVNKNRFYLITKYFFKYIKKNHSVLDIGVYPGTTIKLLKELSDKENLKVNFEGLGLGLDKFFKKIMHDFGVKLYEFDLEKINNKSKINLISKKKYDIILLTDVIEHISNPHTLLEEIHRILKMKGKLIITTDNISRLSQILGMLKGKSPYVPLIESNIFFGGDWRPHFREYDKMELSKLARWNGYKILNHEYYESEFGDYRIHKNKIIKVESRLTIKHHLYRLLKFFFSHLKDNQILILEKKSKFINYNQRPYYTNDTKLWYLNRKKFS